MGIKTQEKKRKTKKQKALSNFSGPTRGESCPGRTVLGLSVDFGVQYQLSQRLGQACEGWEVGSMAPT